MSNTSSSSSSGIGVLGLLGVVFVVLKLTDYIDWSWWLVLLPFYGIFALVITFFLGAFLVMMWSERKDRKQREITLRKRGEKYRL